MNWDDFTDKISFAGDKIGRSLKSLFGSENERMVRSMQPIIAQINELEPWAQELDQDAMQSEMARLKQAIADGEMTLDDALPKVYAMVREASVRTLGLRHFDVQLVGGYVLHQGRIAMRERIHLARGIKQVKVRRPRTDAFHRQQFGARSLHIRHLNAGKIQRALVHRPRNAQHVGQFRP